MNLENAPRFNAIILSSPEPLGSQGELIVYTSSRHPSVHHFQRSCLKPLGQSKSGTEALQSLYIW